VAQGGVHLLDQEPLLNRMSQDRVWGPTCDISQSDRRDTSIRGLRPASHCKRRLFYSSPHPSSTPRTSIGIAICVPGCYAPASQIKHSFSQLSLQVRQSRPAGRHVRSRMAISDLTRPDLLYRHYYNHLKALTLKLRPAMRHLRSRMAIPELIPPPARIYASQRAMN
jgi:hypothetical protein